MRADPLACKQLERERMTPLGSTTNGCRRSPPNGRNSLPVSPSNRLVAIPVVPPLAASCLALNSLDYCRWRLRACRSFGPPSGRPHRRTNQLVNSGRSCSHAASFLPGAQSRPSRRPPGPVACPSGLVRLERDESAHLRPAYPATN